MPTRTPFAPTRRVLLGGALAAVGTGLLAACSGQAPASSGSAGSSGPASVGTVRWQFNWVPDVEWAAWYLAERDGAFADAGVTPELQHGGPNTPAVAQVVAAKQADIGVASDELQLLQANAQGGDFVVLGAMYQRSPFGLTWMTDSGITKPEDLVGKRIGGVQGDQVRLDAMFAVNGLPKDYTFVPMSYDPSPLVKGEMVAITSYTTNQPIQLRNQGEDVTAVTFSDFGLPAYGDVLFASKAWLDANGAAARAALKALQLGVQANIDAPDKGVDLTVDDFGKADKIDRAFATEANAGYIALLESDWTKSHGLLAIDPANLEDKVFAGYAAAGEKDLPAIGDFLDTSYLEGA